MLLSLLLMLLIVPLLQLSLLLPLVLIDTFTVDAVVAVALPMTTFLVVVVNVVAIW